MSTSLYLRGCEHLNQLPPEIVQFENLDLDGTPITDLPLSSNFSKLRSLSLHGNLDLMEIPPSFFDQMPLLSILCLSRTSIQDLPTSFFYLEELREFYLRDCDVFIELSPEIGRLKNLKKLDLDGTFIMHLPEEIQELTSLETLSLSFYGYDLGLGKKYMPYFSSAMIPLGVISKLTHLKHLRIDVNPDNEWWHNNVEQIIAEIAGLERLQTLDLYVPEVKLLKLVPTNRLSNFRLIVGNHKPRIISRTPSSVEVQFKQSNRSLRFVYGVDVPKEVKKILQFVEALFLDCHMTIKDLSQFGLKNLKQLRLCILTGCNEMQSLVDGGESYLHGFLYLEFLNMFYMKSLRSIVEGPTPSHSFSRLRFLALHTCPELTAIFTMNFLDNLSNLEELTVEDCPKVSSIISRQSSEPIAGTFLPSLRKLSLLFLPKLFSISHGLHIGRSLEKIGFYYCPKLESLSSLELSSKNLKVIMGQIEWWEALGDNQAGQIISTKSFLQLIRSVMS